MTMISYVTSGSHHSHHPLVVSSPLDLDLYGKDMLPLVEDISSLEVLLVPPNSSHKIHPNVDSDQDSLST